MHAKPLLVTDKEYFDRFIAYYKDTKKESEPCYAVIKAFDKDLDDRNSAQNSGAEEDAPFTIKICQKFSKIPRYEYSKSLTCYACDEQNEVFGCSLAVKKREEQACDVMHLIHMGENKKSTGIPQESCNAWKTVNAHPLVCFINKFMPHHLYLYHSNERDLGGQGDGEAALIEFYYHDEILAHSAPQRSMQWYRPRLNLLHKTQQGGGFASSSLELYSPYIKDSVLDSSNWLVRRVEQPEVEGKSI